MPRRSVKKEKPVKNVEFVKCMACGGRGFVRPSNPGLKCKLCKGRGVVLSMNEVGLLHLKAMLNRCVAGGKECAQCKEIRKVVRDEIRLGLVLR